MKKQWVFDDIFTQYDGPARRDRRNQPAPSRVPPPPSEARRDPGRFRDVSDTSHLLAPKRARSTTVRTTSTFTGRSADGRSGDSGEAGRSAVSGTWPGEPHRSGLGERVDRKPDPREDLALRRLTPRRKLTRVGRKPINRPPVGTGRPAVPAAPHTPGSAHLIRAAIRGLARSVHDLRHETSRGVTVRLLLECVLRGIASQQKLPAHRCVRRHHGLSCRCFAVDDFLPPHSPRRGLDSP